MQRRKLLPHVSQRCGFQLRVDIVGEAPFMSQRIQIRGNPVTIDDEFELGALGGEWRGIPSPFLVLQDQALSPSIEVALDLHLIVQVPIVPDYRLSRGSICRKLVAPPFVYD